MDGPGEAPDAACDAAGVAATDRDAGLRHVQSGNQGLDPGGVPRAGNGGDHIGAHRLLHQHALDVHGRRLRADRDRFLQRADAHIGVHRGDESACELDALTLDGLEARQRDRHRIRARAQVHDAVLARPVGRHRPRLLDHHGARHFHSHTGEHAARRVPDDAGNGGLRESSRGEEQQHQECRYRPPDLHHTLLTENGV